MYILLSQNIQPSRKYSSHREKRPKTEDLTEVDLSEFQDSQDNILRPVSNNIERPIHMYFH